MGVSLSHGELFSVSLHTREVWPVGQLCKLDRFYLMFVERGSMSLEIDFYPYELNPDSMIIVGSNTFLQCTNVSNDFAASIIVFANDVWHEVTVPFTPSFFAFLKKYPHSPGLSGEGLCTINNLMNAAATVYRDMENSFRQRIFKNFLQVFLMVLYDKTKSGFLHRNDGNTTRQAELLEQFIALLFKHSATHRDVRFYADQLCITRHYLTNVVQKLTGQSPKVFIDTRCIQEIKMMLRTTTLSMQEIAIRMKFPDQSFFARYFRKHAGMSPIEYKEKTDR